MDTLLCWELREGNKQQNRRIIPNHYQVTAFERMTAIDLLDNFNQRNSGMYFGDWHTGNNNYPNDIIGGYTLSYINFNILPDAYGLTSLNNAIKDHMQPGMTAAMVDLLFEKYW